MLRMLHPNAPRAHWRVGKFMLIAAASSALVAIGLGSQPAQAASSLVYCSEGSPENFTPSINTTGTSYDAALPVYDKLVQFAKGGTNIQPALAQSWKISNGGKTIVFALRKGVKIHSGVNGFTPTRDFNADDVIWSFNRQWKADHPYAKVSGGNYSYFSDMEMDKLLKSVEKVDDYTVKIEMNSANVTILANLAMDFSTIHSAEYADFLMNAGHPEQFDQIPVGTGPFIFQSYQKDAVIRYKANPNYWGEKAKVDNLVFSITPDPTTRYAKLKAGECHFASYPRPADLAEMQADPKLQVMKMAGLNIAYLSFNVTKAPLDNKKVRLALTHAIDKAAIIKDVYLGSGGPAKNLIPPTMWSYNNNIKDWPYDVEKAKALLKESGVNGPITVDLWWMPVQRPYNPNSKRIAEMVQSDWAKIGVTANLVSYEWGEYRKRLEAGEHQTGQLGWTGDNGDPDNFFFLAACSDGKPANNNLSKWCNDDFNHLYEQAKTMPKQSYRAVNYMKMQEIMHEEMPTYFIGNSVVYEVARKEVKGYKQSPLGTHNFTGVSVGN